MMAIAKLDDEDVQCGPLFPEVRLSDTCTTMLPDSETKKDITGQSHVIWNLGKL